MRAAVQSFAPYSKRRKSNSLKPAPHRDSGELSWSDAIKRLKGDLSLQRMHEYFQKTADIPCNQEEFASFCLYREFFRRPKRMNSAETMGLICLSYPALKGASRPSSWPLRPEDWRYS